MAPLAPPPVGGQAPRQRAIAARAGGPPGRRARRRYRGADGHRRHARPARVRGSGPAGRLRCRGLRGGLAAAARRGLGRQHREQGAERPAGPGAGRRPRVAAGHHADHRLGARRPLAQLGGVGAGHQRGRSHADLAEHSTRRACGAPPPGRSRAGPGRGRRAAASPAAHRGGVPPADHRPGCPAVGAFGSRPAGAAGRASLRDHCDRDHAGPMVAAHRPRPGARAAGPAPGPRSGRTWPPTCTTRCCRRSP